MEKPPQKKTSDSPNRVCELDSIVPEDPTKPYDVKDVITEILDDGVPRGSRKLQEIVVGFGHLNGSTVGVVANQPKIWQDA